MFSLNQMNGKGFTPAALLILSLSYVASVPCSLYNSTLTWREDPMSFEIPWRLDEVCQNSLECYGRSGYADHVQLCPVFIQQGDSINVTLPIASFYDLRPAIVLPTQWTTCFGLPIVQPINVNILTFETPPEGSTYITQTAGDNGINYCLFGLRVNLTVLGHDCSQPIDDAPICGGHGMCQTITYDTSPYSCVCDYGYYGDHCNELDACSSTQPCLFGGTCRDVMAGPENNNFTCDCADGYAGFDCSLITGSCDHTECNNGTCVGISLQEYRCDCHPGFGGDRCTENIDDCLTNPCVNGICVDQINSYRCMCSNGFTGDFCEINYDDCQLSPCKNNATCIDGVDMYTCDCSPGYTDYNCSSEIDECMGSPCGELGVCTDLINAFTCQCPEDGMYYNETCVLLSPCTQNECENGAMCSPSADWESNYTYSCNCSTGWEGEICDVDINECENIECLNRGNCTDLVGEFRCQCVDGYEGDLCEQEIDECASSPCWSVSTCVDKLNSFTCLCQLGYKGVMCEELVDCDDSPCLQGGTCNSSLRSGEIECSCPPGYNGTYCEYEIDECSASPCQNGVCVDHINGYSCFCQNGWKGVNCDVNHDDCVGSPCQNNATCVDSVSDYSCACGRGFIGDHCEINVDDCINVTCTNGGVCEDLINMYSCDCQSGYEGVLCENDIDECLSTPCQNSGDCTDLVNGFSCACTFPYAGDTCTLLPCDTFPCQNQANCTNTFTQPGYQCSCSTGYMGAQCNENVDDCLIKADGSVPCNNRGVCVDGVNAYDCLCQPGWVGQDCDLPVNDCLDNECRHNSTCVDAVFGYRCLCLDGWEGSLCERETNECADNPCGNGATCIDLFNDFRCDCAAGWYGMTCDLEINECEENSECLNGATCIDLVNDFMCACPPFYTGNLCETFYLPCSDEYNQCQHNSTCVQADDGTFTCQCKPGYDGRLCELNINECQTEPCQNSGTCVDLVNGYLCQCVDGYTGNQCEEEVDECISTPCQNNATCADLVNGFTCYCSNGFSGTLCDSDINECLQIDCRNSATCVNTIGSYRCQCADGFKGEFCEENIDECLESLCENGASCIDGIAEYTCQCLTGFTGTLCQANIDDCTGVNCNNGRCVDGVDTYACVCDVGFEGADCSINTDDCTDSLCINGGTCIDQIDFYTCDCQPGFSGDQCQLDDSVCEEGVCQNGATCVDGRGTAYQCICVEGYEGDQCETNINDCSNSTCLNGGQCIDSVNNYTCSCTEGWTGRDCSVDVNECRPNPCLQNGICVENITPPGFRCLCAAGLGGDICEINYDECESGTACLNGGTCTDLLNAYICTCPEWANGTNCENLLTTSTIPPTTRVTTITTTDESRNMTAMTAETTTRQPSTRTITNTTLSTIVSTLPSLSTRMITQSTPDATSSSLRPTPITSLSTKTTQTVPTTVIQSSTAAVETTRRSSTNARINDTTSSPASISSTAMENRNGTQPQTSTSQSYTTSDTLSTSIPAPATTANGQFTNTTTTTTMTSVRPPITGGVTTAATGTSRLTRPSVTPGSQTTKLTTSSDMPTMNQSASTRSSIGSNTTMGPKQSTMSSSMTSTKTLANSTTSAVMSTSHMLPTTTVNNSSQVTEVDSSPAFSTSISKSTTVEIVNTTSQYDTTTEHSMSTESNTTDNNTHISSPSTISVTAYASHVNITDVTTASLASTTTSATVGLCSCVTCLNGGTCEDIAGDDEMLRYQCLCPLPYSGPRCEHEVKVTYPSFTEFSSLTHYLASTEVLDIVMSLNMRSSGRLMTVYDTTNTQLLINATIDNGEVAVTEQCNQQQSSMSVDQMLNQTLEVHSITIRFEAGDRCSVSLSVDRQTAVTMSADTPAGHTVGSVVFGYSDGDSSFAGCLLNLMMDDTEVDSLPESASGVNIGNCQTISCDHSPCRNGAECIEDLDGWYCDCPAQYGGLYCERRHCDNNPCLHGGTCVVTEDGSDFICLCPYSRHGVDCATEMVINKPHFNGEVYGYSSFISYPKIWGVSAGVSFRLEFVVQSNASLNDSLLLFTGQKGLPGMGSDYIALGMLQGRVVFLFNFGSGPGMLISQARLSSDNSLQSVTFGHNSTKGFLKVNNEVELSAFSLGSHDNLNTQSPLFVGGTDLDPDNLPNEIPFSKQFIGCLYSLQYKSQYDTEWREPGYPAGVVEAGRNVQQCPHKECSVYSCQNGATCQDLGASFRCVCTAGWSGMLCDERSTSTHCDLGTHDCSEGSTCLPSVDSQFTCLCPLGRTGTNCSLDLMISDPLFEGERSHMVLDAVDVRSQTDITIEIKPSAPNGLLFYAAQRMSSQSSGDFIAISLYNQFVQLRLSLGSSSPLILSSNTQIEINAWHTVRINRRTKDVSLSVNGEIVTGVVRDDFSHLDVSQYFYLGGVPDLSKISTMSLQSDPIAYEGCVRKLIVNNYNYPLTARGAVSGVSVKDCDGTQCGHSVCMNGATCTPHADSLNYTCHCSQDFYGINCELPMTCQGRCSAGSKCLLYGEESTYCSCQADQTGDACQNIVPHLLRDGFKMAGTADSLLTFTNLPQLQQNSTINLIVSFNFSTEQDGLILWYGKSTEYDYFGVGVTCDRVRIAWSLGLDSSNELFIDDIIVTDNNWHSLTIISDQKEVSAILDGVYHERTTPGRFTSLDVKVNQALYFGNPGYGIEVEEITGGLYDTPFAGCIRDLSLNNQTAVTLIDYMSTNIMSCL